MTSCQYFIRSETNHFNPVSQAIVCRKLVPSVYERETHKYKSIAENSKYQGKQNFILKFPIEHGLPVGGHVI